MGIASLTLTLAAFGIANACDDTCGGPDDPSILAGDGECEYVAPPAACANT